jgi:outer membrane autotransporter protein
MPNAFYLVAAADNCSDGRREIGDKFGEESFFDEKSWSLWGSIGRTQGHTKNHISHRDRIFTGMIGCNFSNCYGKSFGIFVGVSNAEIDCTGQNRGTSGQQSGVCMGAYGATALGGFVVRYSSMICYARFRYDQDLKSVKYAAQNLRAHSRYYGLSCFSKLSLAYVLRGERYVLCPEISLHLAWVSQLAHDAKAGGHRPGGFEFSKFNNFTYE